MSGRLRISRVLCAGLVLAAGVLAARAQDGADPELPKDLGAALEAWDDRDPGGFTNTIPFEKAVLAAGAAGKVEELAAACAHARFGELAFVVLCEHVKAPPEARVLAVWNAFPAARRAGSAVTLAALRTDAVRAALKAFATAAEVSGDARASAAVSAALLRAGDAAAEKSVRDALASKDGSVVAKALLRAGDARAAAGFLRDAARLAADARKLAEPVASAWSDQKSETTADGMTTTTQVPVQITTVGEAAIEAANRMSASPLPGFVAWWYEAEKGPRFGRGAAAVTLLRDVDAADDAAAKAKSLRFAAAVAAIAAAVRAGGEEGRAWRLTGAAFDRVWTLRHEIDGTAGTATVAADGRVTLK